MPSLDGGHYFLTTLVPIKTDMVDDGQGTPLSCAQHLRETLAYLPTARHSPALQDSPLNSPFSRNTATHFIRLVVIDDVIYNGRLPENTLRTTVFGPDPLIPQPMDQLTCPYLAFIADFDAPTGAPQDVTAWLTSLWESMQPELREIFQYCTAFEKVDTGAGFAAYVRQCEIDTTMPFNDYWVGGAPLKNPPVRKFLMPPVAAALAAIAAALVWCIAPGLWGVPWGALAGICLAACAASVALLVRGFIRKARAPFPTAPGSDLPTILKAVYLQRVFTEFAEKAQDMEAEALHRAFGEFLSTHKPDASDAPTHPPGVVFP